MERSFDNGEGMGFEVSTDGGATWTTYRSLSGNVDPEEVWHSESVLISGAASVQFRFSGTMSSSAEDGYVDNVVVETAP